MADITTNTLKIGDNNLILRDADAQERIAALEQGGGTGSGLTDDIKQAMLQIARKVAYIDEHGQDYYDDLYDALYAVTAIRLDANSIMLTSIGSTQQLTATTTPAGGTVTWASSNTNIATVSNTGLVTSVGYGSCTVTASSGSVSASCAVAVSQVTLTSISADYQQSGTVYDTASLDSLKNDLTVTAIYSDSSTATVTEYTLSGTLTAGTSTITVSYGGKTTTFNVTVTAVPTLTSISAVYTQSGTVYDTDSLDSLKDDLVVTAHWSNGTTSTVASADYTLSGTLAEGTSAVTVDYGGKTTTFNVTVSAGDPLPSDYTRAEYVYMSAGSMSFVNTGVTPSENGDIGIDITFMQTEDKTTNHYFVAVPGASTSATIGAGVGVSADNTDVMAFNGILSSIKPNGATSITNEKISVSAMLTQTSSSITDGTNSDSESGTGRVHNYPIYLWGMRRGDGTGYLQYPSAGRIYSLVVTDGGVEILNLIPCTRNSDNKVGFYNAVNGDFIGVG